MQAMPKKSAPQRQKLTARPVFISHAAADADLVNLFVDQLLTTGIGIGREHIFNVSAKTKPISAGDNFSPEIRSALTGAKIVIAVITPTYLKRPFTMAELGAAWALKRLLPILVPPIDFSMLEGVLQGVQCIRLSDGSALHELYDCFDHKRLNKENWFERVGSATFAAALATFQKSLPSRLEEAPKPSSPSQGRPQSLDGGVPEGTNGTSKPKLTPEEEQRQFRSHLDSIRGVLRKLPALVRLAFVYHARGEEAMIASYLSKATAAIRDAERKGFLQTDTEIDASNGPMVAFWPDLTSQHVRDANDAIEALKTFLVSVSSDFRRAYEEKHGHAVSERLTAFWEEHELLGKGEKVPSHVYARKS